MLPEKQKGQTIAQIWYREHWYFSITDVVRSLINGEDAHVAWAKIKRRLKREGASATLASHKKFRDSEFDIAIHGTEYADMETLLRIIQSIPSSKTETIRQWLAHAGVNNIDQEKRGIPPGEGPHWMGSEEMADNIFRDAQSRAYIRRLDIRGKEPVIEAHETVSQEVRDTIIRLGNTPPEQLPKAKKSIEQAQKDEERRRLQGMDLWPELDEPATQTPAEDDETTTTE